MFRFQGRLHIFEQGANARHTLDTCCWPVRQLQPCTATTIEDAHSLGQPLNHGFSVQVNTPIGEQCSQESKMPTLKPVTRGAWPHAKQQTHTDGAYVLFLDWKV